MRIIASFVFLVIFAALAFGQSSTPTRPRVVATAMPPRIVNAPNNDAARNSPPVLVGRDRNDTPRLTPTPPLDDDAVIRVETNLVTLPVSVLDRDGRFISGLQQNDFRIFENGVEQKVDYFQTVEQPFTVILLIDVSPSTAFRIDDIQNAAITFIDQLRSGDRVAVIAFDEFVQVLSPITSNRNQLRRAIREARFGEGTGLYEAVDYVIENPLRDVKGRKAVVLFTDGVDNTSTRASYESTLRSTEEIDAMFYTIRYDTLHDDVDGGYARTAPKKPSIVDIFGAIFSGGNSSGGGGGGGGRMGTPAQYATGKLYLETLARNTGGREFEARSMFNLDAALAGIAEELRRQYSVGYYPDNVGKVGDRKRIKIRVMRPNVVVRAKNSYVVGQTNRDIAGR